VYATDRSEALISFAVVATAASLIPPPLHLHGLAPDRAYRVTHLALPGERPGPARTQPPWLAQGATMTGSELAGIGVQPPSMHPETAILIHLQADGDAAGR
jgi:alpha-galactosidase